MTYIALLRLSSFQTDFRDVTYTFQNAVHAQWSPAAGQGSNWKIEVVVGSYMSKLAPVEQNCKTFKIPSLPVIGNLSPHWL